MKLPFSDETVQSLHAIVIKCAENGDDMKVLIDKLIEVVNPYKETLAEQGMTPEHFVHTLIYSVGQKIMDKKKTKDLVDKRVRVFDGSGQKPIGEGTYVGDVKVYFIVMPDGSLRSLPNAEEPPPLEMVPDMAEVICKDNNPKIILDDGRTVYGCQVWWEPIAN